MVPGSPGLCVARLNFSANCRFMWGPRPAALSERETLAPPSMDGRPLCRQAQALCEPADNHHMPSRYSEIFVSWSSVGSPANLATAIHASSPYTLS